VLIAPGGFNTAGGQSCGDVAQGGCTRLADDVAHQGADLLGVGVGLGLDHLDACGAADLRRGAAQLLALALERGQGLGGALADALGFVLREHRHHLQEGAVGLGHIGAHEGHLAVEQRADELDIAGQAVELGHHQGGLLLAGEIQGGLQHGPVAQPLAGARLHLGELADELPAATVEERGDELALGVQAKAGLPLAVGADAVVGDEAPGVCGHGGPQRVTQATRRPRRVVMVLLPQA